MPVNLLADAQGLGGVHLTAQRKMGGIVNLILFDVDITLVLFVLLGLQYVTSETHLAQDRSRACLLVGVIGGF